MRSGRPPTLWWLLIVTDGPPVKRDALDHVRIERALGEEIGAADLLRLLLEHVDEELADGLALGLRVGDARERAEEQVLRLHVDERDVVVVAEQRDDLLGLACAHQAVVDEDAGELVADRLVDQHRGDGGIDAAGQAADHPAGADLGADARDGLLAEGRHGPVARAARDVAHEVAEQLRAVRRVHHLRVELHGVELAAPRPPPTAKGAFSDTASTSKPAGSLVTRSPWLIQTGYFSPTCQTPWNSGLSVQDLDLGAAELGMMPALDLAAELRRHGLLAVADAEDRQAGLEQLLRRAGRRVDA